MSLMRLQMKRNALDRDAHTCQNCGATAEHVHHIVPLIRGGKDVMGNLVSLCAVCHGAIHGIDWNNHRELTKAGLAAAKARGVKLGGLRPGSLKENAAAKAAAAARSEDLRPILAPLHSSGASLRTMADAMEAAGITTRKGTRVGASAVRNHLQRLGLSTAGRRS